MPACIIWAHEKRFIAPAETRRHAEGEETAADSVRARFLFAENATNNFINERFAQGAVVKTTKLTEEFTYAAFKQKYQGSVLLLFIIREGGELNIVTASEEPAPKPGQTLIALVDPVANVQET